MKMKKVIEKNWTTSDFYTAVFLRATGLNLIGIDKSDGHRFQFVFKEAASREGLIDDFFAGRATVEPRQFVAAIKELKNLMYSDAL